MYGNPPSSTLFAEAAAICFERLQAGSADLYGNDMLQTPHPLATPAAGRQSA